jgi:hypothetical protein
MSVEEARKIIHDNKNSILIRSIHIEYQAIDSKKLYTTIMEQDFNFVENRWIDEKEIST